MHNILEIGIYQYNYSEDLHVQFYDSFLVTVA